MNISVEVPAKTDARVTKAFCTDRQQDGETEEECINRIVSSYVNQVVVDYERNKAIQEAQNSTPDVPVIS